MTGKYPTALAGAALTVLAGCSGESEEWLLAVQGNRLNETSVSTKFAVSTGRTFASRATCIDALNRIGVCRRKSGSSCSCRTSTSTSASTISAFAPAKP